MDCVYEMSKNYAGTVAIASPDSPKDKEKEDLVVTHTEVMVSHFPGHEDYNGVKNRGVWPDTKPRPPTGDEEKDHDDSLTR
ncbi:hypothetical protein HDU96_010573 [Phlyctochytrium bullatum]|nr:hypothetical protein HDU96_010573 [Phlyctochytrium bullatum]